MPTVTLTLPHHAYDVVIEPGVLDTLGDTVRSAAPHDRAGLFMDAAVEEGPGHRAAAALESAGYEIVRHTLIPGEEHKHLETVRSLYQVALENHLERSSPFVSVGGGVVGDTVGFAAATWLRGVPFVQCPTTLLAMVDASVGGKTGVNLPAGKNLVGAFHQPVLVAIDPTVLETLPARELRCGLAECVKHGMIRDEALFDWIDAHVADITALHEAELVELVHRNVQIKAAVVIEDEREAGVRAHLNFGHTFAHAIEATGDYHRYHHGEAVAIGMVAAARLAVAERGVDPSVTDRLVGLLEKIGLPSAATDLPGNDELLAVMRRDKKVADGRIRLVLPTRVGAVGITDSIDDDAIARAWDAVRDA